MTRETTDIKNLLRASKQPVQRLDRAAALTSETSSNRKLAVDTALDFLIRQNRSKSRGRRVAGRF